jgi:isoleucyl-tRNA synthetase
VHLCDWPAADDSWRAPELAAAMETIRELASLGLAARANVGVRVRQPLQAAEVVLARPESAEELRNLNEILREELNVREIRYSADASRFVKFTVKPDFRALGKKLGKDMKACQAALAGMDGGEVRARVLGGGLSLDLPAGAVVLGPEEIIVEVAPLPGFQASGSATAVVALHAELSESLLEEGLAREITSKVQALRKGMGLQYADRVVVAVAGGERTTRCIARFGDSICADTGASFGDAQGETAELAVDGETTSLRVQRLG